MQRTTEKPPETNLQPLLFHIIYIYYRHRTPVFVRRLHIYFFRFFFRSSLSLRLFMESSAPESVTNECTISTDASISFISRVAGRCRRV